MKANIFIVLSVLASTQFIKAQNFIIFKGSVGKGSDSAYYCFNNDLSTQVTIHPDAKGNYTLRLKLQDEATISFYYANNECEQRLDLKKIKAYVKETECQTLQNDLTVIRGIACIRTECQATDITSPIMGDYKSLDTRSLSLNCYYKRTFIEKDVIYNEEGTWTVADKIISFQPAYIINTRTGTYKQNVPASSLRYEHDKLIKANGEVDFFKK